MIWWGASFWCARQDPRRGITRLNVDRTVAHSQHIEFLFAIERGGIRMGPLVSPEHYFRHQHEYICMKVWIDLDTVRRTNTDFTHDHLLLDSAPYIGPLISRWELDKFKNCWNKNFRTSKILTLLYEQFSNLLISQRDMSGPRLWALSNNRWSGGNHFRRWRKDPEPWTYIKYIKWSKTK
jgi:hypothetical protein